MTRKSVLMSRVIQADQLMHLIVIDGNEPAGRDSSTGSCLPRWRLVSAQPPPRSSHLAAQSQKTPLSCRDRQENIFRATQRRFPLIVPGKNVLKLYVYISRVKKRGWQKKVSKLSSVAKTKSQKANYILIINNKNKGHDKYILNSGKKQDFKCLFT